MKFYPYKINDILTDNGFEFSYKALPKTKKTKKIHPFDTICKENKIGHRTIKFKHPWTNRMVENFNKKIKNKLLTKYRFQSIIELNDKLINFINDYNMNKRLKSLNYKNLVTRKDRNKNLAFGKNLVTRFAQNKTPIQYLKDEKGIIIERIVI